MPLPKISTPLYEMEIPSTGKKIKYRPFLVREEKILIMALESENMKQITSAIVQILGDCISTRGVKIKDLATFDIEYIFLNVRAKSVGESVEVNIICPDDAETQVRTTVDIDSISVQRNPEHEQIIRLDNELSMKMKYPSLDQFIENNFEYNSNDDNVDKSLDMIISCVDMIYNKEESWSSKDCTHKELKDFVEQMNTKQLKEIENFFATMPKLMHTVNITNPNTNVDSEVVLEGLASFFT